MNQTVRSLFGILTLFFGVQSISTAQCPSGEVEVTIDIHTDDYGYEMYWELTPSGNACGAGTIASGGNLTIGCTGAGAQVQNNSGYGNNTTITEGPWCLAANADFDIHWADDYGDGGFSADVKVDGVVVAQFTGVLGSPVEVFTFNASPPVARDMSVTHVSAPRYAFHTDPIVISGTLKSLGLDPVNSFDLNYSIDGGAPVTATISGVTLNAGDEYLFAHPQTWMATTSGTYQLAVWASNINGGNDLAPNNDQNNASVILSNPIPNIIDDFLTSTPVTTTVANSGQDILVPRDLDFHPEMARRELWIINKDTENSGGSTVTFNNLEMPNETFQWKRDGNAWHFMSLPTGMAMGDNGFWATSNGVFDANHNGAPPFTGPTLWESDMNIYAEPAGPGSNGSHMDMLHESPYAQGIAHEKNNVYWVTDGYSSDIVRYDFRDDHGPGQHYHGDAIVRRYSDISITKDPNDHIVSHCVLDKKNDLLYAVDHGGQRVIRIDITTGTVGGTPPFASGEGLTEYTMVTGYAHDVIINTGLIEPAGIEIIDDRLLVSEHSTGEVIIYDISDPNNTPELGRIQLSSAGLMGIKLGPDGNIWGVNATTHELRKATPGAVSVNDIEAASSWTLAPNPSNELVYVTGTISAQRVEVIDLLGKVVMNMPFSDVSNGIAVKGLSEGNYTVKLFLKDGSSETKRLSVVR